MKIVYVKWVDAHSESGWIKHEETADIVECESIGFVVRETEKSITLAVTVHEKECNSTIAIPKAWILKRKTIKLS